MRGVLGLAVLLMVGTARADTSVDLQQPADESPPRPNHWAVQTGLLPSLSVLGLEYSRVALQHLQISGSLSYGYTFDIALVPRVRWPFGRSAVAVGVAPSLAWQKGGLTSGDEPSGWFLQWLADAELTHETPDHWLLQARIGTTALRSRSMELVFIPVIGLGAGRAF